MAAGAPSDLMNGDAPRPGQGGELFEESVMPRSMTARARST